MKRTNDWETFMESPFLLERNGLWYLLFTYAHRRYTETIVIVSDDPNYFDFKHMKQLLNKGQEDLNNPANCRPAGRAKKPLKFLIPRPGKTGEEAHFPVNPAFRKK